MEHKALTDSEETMIVLDASLLAALAAIITACSTMVWALRRKP